MQQGEISAKIMDYIVMEFLEGDSTGLEVSSPLLEWGIIDSLAMVRLVGFLEEQFGIAIKEDDITPYNFANVVAIAQLILSYKQMA